MPDLDQTTRDIAPRVQEEIDSFRASHQGVMDALNALETQITPEQSAAWANLRETIMTTYRDTRLMAALLEEMAECLKLMSAQRQSSRQMYLAGYQSLMTDLAARTSGPEYVQLRRLLVQIEAEDDLPY